ncbi:MAG: hypothetical protein JW891_09085 [Candidatus Lokiarchaeota archaeon]|nr:hypothetical protein [Candidatus Lokiarchaeota archaeon]
MNPSEHFILFFIVLGLIVLLSIFLISTLVTHFKQKQRTGIYLSLVYGTFLVGLVLIIIGHATVAFAGIDFIEIYNNLTMVAMAFLIAGILFMVLFHSEINEIKKASKYIEILIGVIVIIIILLPFNYITYFTTAAGNNAFRILTYVVMSIYGIISFAHLAYSYFILSKKSTQKRKQLKLLGYANAIFLIFYVLMAWYGMAQITILLTMAMLCLYVSFIGYFLAIYLPKLTS